MRAVGLASLLVLGLLIVGPHVLSRREAARGAPSARAGASPPRSAALGGRERAGEAAAAVASLASAMNTLAELKAQAAPEEVPVVAPAPTEFSSPAACFRSYLPGVELSEAALSFVCSEADLWTIERKSFTELVHREGEGARLWARLGRFSLAAVATLRAGCCVAPEPPKAVVAGLWCGILRDKLRAFGAIPDAGATRDFDLAISCLEERGAHLPDHFRRASPESDREAFREFSRIARARGKPQKSREAADGGMPQRSPL